MKVETQISHGELGRQLTLTGNAALSCGQAARGRVLLALVFEYYSAGKNAMVMFDINHIQRITLKGDSLESFQTHFDDGYERIGDNARYRDLAVYAKPQATG